MAEFGNSAKAGFMAIALYAAADDDDDDMIIDDTPKPAQVAIKWCMCVSTSELLISS